MIETQEATAIYQQAANRVSDKYAEVVAERDCLASKLAAMTERVANLNEVERKLRERESALNNQVESLQAAVAALQAREICAWQIDTGKGADANLRQPESAGCN